MNLRKEKNNRRIVMKIGTSSLTHATGKLNYRRIEEMVGVLCDLKNMGHEIIIVSSGAAGVGLGRVDLMNKPAEMAKRRALAAIGQSGLMAIYESLFGIYKVNVSQVLLTKSVLDNAVDNIASAFWEIFNYGAIPIVNENDVVVSDTSFGNNDTLAAEVAKFVDADLLIIWSDIDGLFDKDPRQYSDAKIIKVVPKISKRIERMAGGTGSTRGCGGMATKIVAAKLVTNAGIGMIITNSARPEDLYKIVDDIPVGTFFCAQRRNK